MSVKEVIILGKKMVVIIKRRFVDLTAILTLIFLFVVGELIKGIGMYKTGDAVQLFVFVVSCIALFVVTLNISSRGKKDGIRASRSDN